MVGRLELAFFGFVLLCMSILSFFSHQQAFVISRFRAPVPTFAVIFDAGSTGSRVHVFQFDDRRQLIPVSGGLSAFQSVDGGLSGYASEPESLRSGIASLASFALRTTAQTSRARVFAFLGATAGLRLLPDETREALLGAATNEISRVYPAISGRVIDGQEEALYLLETVSFLTKDETAVVVDLGGASVQLAFRSPRPPLSEAERHFIQPRPDGSHVYLHSWLGFGLKAARMRILQGKETSACVRKSVEFSYGEERGHVKPGNGSCQEEVIDALSIGQGCAVGLQPCAFSGGWRGPHSSGKVYLFSFIFDVAVKLGLMAGQSQAQLSVDDFVEASKRECDKDNDDEFLCIDSTFVAILISRGLGLPSDQQVTVANRLSYQGLSVEAAWPLGAALTQLH